MDPKTVSGILKRKQPLDQNLRQILLIRHGSTDLNNQDTSVDRIRGWSDVPLNEEGRQQAVETGKKIAKNPPDVMVSSDLSRAAETAQIVSQITGTPLAGTTPYFRPWNVGKFAGQVSKKAIPVLAQYAAERPNDPLPDGESFNQFRHRFFTGISQALQQHPQGEVAIVTHHRNERLLHSWQKAGFPPNGDIDIPTFNSKGENTGAALPMTIPVDKIHAVAQGNHENAPVPTQAAQPQPQPQQAPAHTGAAGQPF